MGGVAAVGGSAVEPGRLQRWLVGVTIVGLLLATGAAFSITERLKLTPAPITGTRISKLFSPVCRCSTDSASIVFRLRRRGEVEVDVLDSTGAMVRRLARGRLGPGFVSFRWRGYRAGGRISRDGAYRVLVRLYSEHRTIVLPNVIRLITVAPSISRFSSDLATIRPGERLRLSYRFSVSAHPILLVDGRRLVYGRFAHTAGTLDWFGKVAGIPIASGRHTLALEARDDAGNTSPPSAGIDIRIKPTAPAKPARPRKQVHKKKK